MSIEILYVEKIRREMNSSQSLLKDEDSDLYLPYLDYEDDEDFNPSNLRIVFGFDN